MNKMKPPSFSDFQYPAVVHAADRMKVGFSPHICPYSFTDVR